MKRNHISPTGNDKYGHWWFEIGDPADLDSESYGWWPNYPVNLKRTLKGISGELNGQTCFNGTTTRDPHHGDDADEEFHPWVSMDDPRTDEQIGECLRNFALSYSGGWRWMLGVGPNCHTFQKDAMAECKLRKHPPKSWW